MKSSNRSCARALGLVLVASGLGGCASYFTRPADPIGYTKFGAAGPAVDAPKPAAAEGKDPATAPPPASTPSSDMTVLDFAAVKFAQALRDSANDSTNDGHARSAILAGRSLLNLRCSDYLDQIGLKNQQVANERRHVDIVGGFASAIMGLTGSPAKAVAGVASSFSFAGSSMDSASATFLFSDASKAINRLVRDASDKYVSKLNEYSGKWTYADAVDILTGYEELCRPAGIRRLVDEAISTAPAKLVADGSAASTPAKALFVRPTIRIER